MFKKFFVVFALATLGLFVTFAQGSTIIFNTDTGVVDSIDGGAFGDGTSSGTCYVDAASQMCTWTFVDNLVVPSGTTLQFVGSNRASVKAGDIIFGTAGGDAVTISASSYLDGLGDLVRGAGGGLGGDGGHGGIQGTIYENGGAGGVHGEGSLSGSAGSLQGIGARGSSGYRGSLGGIGAGSLASNEVTFGGGGGGGMGGLCPDNVLLQMEVLYILVSPPHPVWAARMVTLVKVVPMAAMAASVRGAHLSQRVLAQRRWRRATAARAAAGAVLAVRVPAASAGAAAVPVVIITFLVISAVVAGTAEMAASAGEAAMAVGAAGTVRLVGTVIGGSGLITGNMAGGVGEKTDVDFEDGYDGQLIIAQDCRSTVNTTMQAGALVTGRGSDVGLHRYSSQLNVNTPRLLGLAEGNDSTGILEASAADLGLEGVSACPVSPVGTLAISVTITSDTTWSCWLGEPEELVT